MAFNPNQLSVLAYANGFTLWHYITEDPGEQVAAPGYFDPAFDLVRAGDFVLLNLPNTDAGVLLIGACRPAADGVPAAVEIRVMAAACPMESGAADAA